MQTKYERLEAALVAVSLTSLSEIPGRHYMLDMLVINAVINPEELLAREEDLLLAIEGFPDLFAALDYDVPEGVDLLGDTQQAVEFARVLEKTSYIALGSILSSQNIALRLIAALVTLSRTKMYSLLNLGASYEAAVTGARKGFLSIAGTTLDRAAPRAQEEVK